MTKDEIEKAAKESALNDDYIDHHVETGAHIRGFMAGAQFREDDIIQWKTIVKDLAEALRNFQIAPDYRKIMRSSGTDGILWRVEFFDQALTVLAKYKDVLKNNERD